LSNHHYLFLGVRYDIIWTHLTSQPKETTPTTPVRASDPPTTRTPDFTNIPKYARSSKRGTITIPFHVFNAVVNRSLEEGRSVSNLMAYLLERAIEGKF